MELQEYGCTYCRIVIASKSDIEFCPICGKKLLSLDEIYLQHFVPEVWSPAYISYDRAFNDNDRVAQDILNVIGNGKQKEKPQ